jgi:casein kinase 1, epsilon
LKPKYLMNLVVNSRFSIKKKIGSGSFSNVYICEDINDKKEVALKLESAKKNTSLLEFEAKILKLLEKESIKILLIYRKYILKDGFPRLQWSGKEGDFNIMAMDLLGPSLADLFEYCQKKFSLKTVIMLADQMVIKGKCLNKC